MSVEIVELASLEPQWQEKTFAFICRYFPPGSVLHMSMHITESEYRDYFRDAYYAMLKQNLSIAAVNMQTKAVMGCLLATEFKLNSYDPGSLPHKFRPILVLLDKLEKQYIETRGSLVGKQLLVDLALVHPDAIGAGIYTALRKSIYELGRQHGFKLIVGELSAAATQHVLIKKFGHRVITEVNYAEFSYNGEKPFKDIQSPKSIQLVECELN